MPGLNQLKQFNADILNLGDEVKIRSARGEKPVTVKIPKKISTADDSADFANGMPVVSEEEFQQAEAAAAEREKEKYNVSGLFDDDSAKKEEAPAAPDAPIMPDLSDILNPGSDISISDDDLSDFEEPAEEEEEEEEEESTPIEDLDLDSLLAFSGDGTVPTEEEEDDYSSSDEEEAPAVSEESAPAKTEAQEEDEFDLSSFVSDVDPMAAQASESPSSENESAEAPTVPEVEDTVTEEEPVVKADSFDDLADMSSIAGLDNLDSDNIDNSNIEEVSDLAEPVEESGGESVAVQEDVEGAASEELPSDVFDASNADSDFQTTEASLDLTESLPDELKEEPDAEALAAYEAQKAQVEEEEPESPAEEQSFDVSDIENMDFSAPSDEASVENAEASIEDSASVADIPPLDEGLFAEAEPSADETVASEDEFAAPEVSDVADLPSVAEEEIVSESPVEDSGDLPSDAGGEEETVSSPDTGDTGLSDLGLDDLPDFSDSGDAIDAGSYDASKELPKAEESAGEASSELGDMQLPEMGDLSDLGSIDSDGSSEAEGSSPEDTVEAFDTSGMDGVDFSAPPDVGNDFELGNITAQEGNEDFSIPGFSDTVTANLNKKVEEPVAQEQEGGAPSKPKNTFTDAEYKRFLENLEHYPLNIRLAIELFATKSDFTDEAQFEIFEKVLKKAPAKQVASELEKMLSEEDLKELGIQSLSVPKDFERRSNEEWEAYKKTPQYQLKNRILPMAILSTAAAVLILCIWILSDNFVYKPLMARHFYKQGYELVQENMYPQSEDKFNRALLFRSVKNWFYKYAALYREHKQYDRAENMYRQILKRFDQDKAAGLALADMLANDTFNYSEAEKVLKREVLDYYVNDYDGILQLGDTYLEWAGTDPTKFDDAKTQYDLLYEIYGGDKKLSPKILSRQMRYYVRTDNLPQVLQYKEGFFPDNKNLDSDDLVEVSGYLLDKRYSDLPPSQEYLRSHIEGLRGLLETAVKSNPSNPTALYNMGRYYVKTDNNNRGKSCFNQAIELFNAMRPRSTRDTYKLIDTYRLLGEEYAFEEKYIDAETQYAKGKDLFEKENASNKNFRGTQNIGKLYADLGDIDYFVSGDMSVALDNYVKSVNCENDTPSIRYRIGYIQYTNRNFPEALMSFRLSSEGDPSDTHSLLALANTLSLRDDNYAAQGYYEKVLRLIDSQRQLYGIMLPQVREDHGDIVETYMKASNNLGVTLSRIADMTGNSKYNAQAIVSLQDSLRAWDALSRNQDTMIRAGGSNLAEQNIKYLTEPKVKYSPEIYTNIPMVKNDEKGL